MAVVIAPWLRGTDVIGSASAGANVGLAMRARDLQAAAQAQEAEQFIARLNQQSSQFDRNLRVEQDVAASRLAQALRQQDALDMYRREQLAINKTKAAAAASKLLRDNLEPEIRDIDGGRLLRRGPQSWQFVPDPSASKESVRTPAQWSAYINGLEKRLEDTNISPEEKANSAQQLRAALTEQKKLMLPGLPTLVPQVTPGTPGVSPWFGRNTPATPPTTNWVESLQGANAPAPASAPTVTTKAQWDQLPSGAVYIGKDGKRFQKP